MIDLSRSMRDNMPCYPGDPKMTVKKAKNIEAHGCDVTEISFGSHTGSHVDAPSHMIKGGKTLSDLDLSHFCGVAVKVALKDSLDDLLKKFEPDGVILETGWGKNFADPDHYYGDKRPLIPVDFANALLRGRIKFFGCDLPSVDKSGAGAKTIHIKLLSNDIILYENLAKLENLPEKIPFIFTGFPLNIFMADGSPVRAVAEIGRI